MYRDKLPSKIFFDASADSLEVKIERARALFKEQTKQEANFCSVPHSSVPNGKPEIEGVKVFTTNLLTKNTFWLGVADPGDVRS